MLGSNGGLYGTRRVTTPVEGAGIWTPNERCNIKNRIFSDPYFNQVSLLLHFDGAFSDSGPNKFTGTASGNAGLSSNSYFGSGGAVFDGNGDWITYPYDSALVMGVLDFTVELFVKLNFIPQNIYGDDASRLIGSSIGTFGNVGGDAMGLGIGTTSFYLRAGYGSYNSAPLSWQTNRWYHLAATKSGRTIRLFLDGVVSNTYTNVDTNSTGCSNRIGCHTDGSGQTQRCFNGWLDEVRITKGLARYTANFTVPTGPYPDRP